MPDSGGLADRTFHPMADRSIARRAGGYQRTGRLGMCRSTRARSCFSLRTRVSPWLYAAHKAAPSRTAQRLLHVAMGDRHVEVLVLAVALGQVLRDRDRAMAPARAADRDNQVRLALGDV